MAVVVLIAKFPDDATAEEWIAAQRWLTGLECLRCGRGNVQHPTAHKTMPYRCRGKGCRKWFSVRTGTVVADSKLGYQKWALAVCLFNTNIKGTSSLNRPARSGDQPEGGVALGAPHPRDMGRSGMPLFPGSKRATTHASSHVREAFPRTRTPTNAHSMNNQGQYDSSRLCYGSIFIDINVRAVPRDLWQQVRVAAVTLDMQIRGVVIDALGSVPRSGGV